MKISISACIGILSLFVIIGCSNSSDKNEENDSVQPNIIIIMADDMGYNDIGCYGNKSIITPNIDFLAHNGIRFNDYHSNGPVCSPTRAALMTGRYQQRAGIEAVVTAKNHRDTGISPEEFTIADFLKENNYKTGIVGKWHLGYDTTFSPVNNGFDYFQGFVSGNVDYHSHLDQEGYFDWWIDKDTSREEGYSTDLISEAAIQFIEESKDSPFFLYVAHEAPHYPYQGRNDPVVREENGKMNTQGSRLNKEGAYKEMIEVMDEGIGDLVNYLRKQKLLANTFILFCSDNGASAIGSNFPLKGFNASLWEGGHRVPALAYWEGKIQPGLTNQTVMTMDIFPSLVEMVKPGNSKKYDFDGSSFMHLLSSDIQGNDLSDRSLFWRFRGKKAVRRDEWKMVMENNKIFLFNLDEDISEKNNLIDEFPGIRDSLIHSMEDWELEMLEYEQKTN